MYVWVKVYVCGQQGKKEQENSQPLESSVLENYFELCYSVYKSPGIKTEW